MLSELLIDIANNLANSTVIQNYTVSVFNKQTQVMIGSPGQIDISEYVPIIILSNIANLSTTYEREILDLQVQIYVSSETIEKIGLVNYNRGYLILEELAEKVRWELLKKHGGKSVNHQSFVADTFPLWYCEELVKIEKAVKKPNF